MVDHSKLTYYSEWDIDQLVDTNQVPVAGSGSTFIKDIGTLDVPALPSIEVQFRPTGSSRWFQPGRNSTSNLAASFTFYWYLSGTSLYIQTSGAGTARYFIWSDKVNN